jgi:hypothetical protein
MSTTISPDRAADDPLLFPDTVPRSILVNRRHEEANTQHDGTGTGPAAKVVRWANANEEAEAQEGDETPETSLTTEEIMDLLKDLRSDDKCVIARALTKIAELSIHRNYSGRRDSPEENEVKIRELGVHVAVLQVLKKHVDCLGIQQPGLRAVVNFSRLMPT